MCKDIKELIKIPDGLDNSILKGFEEGKKQRKAKKRNKIIKRTSVAAALVVVSITTAGIINPEIVSAIPIINRVFEYFNDTGMGYNVDKYKELGKVINETIDKDGVKITLDQIIIDDNNLMASFTVESEVLGGYENKNNPGDFFRPNFNLKVNGETPSSWGQTVTIINETKGAVVLKADISNIKLNEEIKLDLGIRGIERGWDILSEGNWEYNIKTIKDIKSESYTGDRSIKVDEGELWVDSLNKTQLTNRLVIKGKYNGEINSEIELSRLSYLIKDNNGNELYTEGLGGFSDRKGNYQTELEILNDLSNVKYIEIIPLKDDRLILRDVECAQIRDLNGSKTTQSDEMKIQVPLLICTNDSASEINRKEEFISREPDQEQLKSGYGLSIVPYYLNIDRSKAFLSIDDIVEKEIKVNNTDKVTITNIDTNDKYTKINMKIDGSYDYRNLSRLVIFDEDMKDTCTWEGNAGPVLENMETKEVSYKLGPIDKNKKYTIAIPMAKELKYNEENKIFVKLK